MFMLNGAEHRGHMHQEATTLCTWALWVLRILYTATYCSQVYSCYTMGEKFKSLTPAMSHNRPNITLSFT